MHFFKLSHLAGWLVPEVAHSLLLAMRSTCASESPVARPCRLMYGKGTAELQPTLL